MFHKGLGNLEIDIVTLYARFTVGAAGAPTIDVSNSKGIASIARNSAGEYKVTLSDQYQKLYWCSAINLSTTASDPTTDGVGFRVEDDQAVAAVPYVQVQFYALDDGVAADPKNGQVILLKFEFRNSTVT
jgi:hypothetical protein